ncbi:MAG TPA: metallopeptidase TldD-related protein [Acidimicrobiales bacterium]|nr:metallopeptidase TldD-related protein [Acidimicrobiales bacterium]
MSGRPEIVEQALALSKADDCIVIASDTSTANARWANSTATTNGVTTSNHLQVVSVVGRRVGSVGVTNPTPDTLESVVRRSEAACEGRPEAEDAMPLLPGGGPAAGWDDGVDAPGVAVFAGLAPSLGDIFGRSRSDGIALFGYAEHTSTTTWLGTSTGVRLRDERRQGRLELNAKTPDFARSAWVGSAPASFGEVDVASLYDHLRGRLDWAATPVDMPAGHYDVVLEPSAAADMLYFLYMSAGRREADEGRSVFSRPGGGSRIGEQLFPAGVQLYSDPAEPGLEVTPFVVTAASSSYASLFDNGLPLGRTDWVRDGVLANLISTRHWAARSGDEATPYVDNLVLDSPGTAGVDGLVAATTGRALLVTCFWYIREVDPQTLLLTGLTRDGVYLVEDGEVRGAVNNFRFNMSPVDMLAQTVEMGATGLTLPREFGDYFQTARVPALRVERFNMSSVSAAT